MITLPENRHNAIPFFLVQMEPKSCYPNELALLYYS